MKRAWIYAAAAVILAALCAGFFFLGDKQASESMTIKRVSPDQLARAMQQDHFYSDYRHNTLLVTGRVKSANQEAGGQLLTFDTSSSYRARCKLTLGMQPVTEGETVTLLTEGGSAKRQPDGVLLKACVRASTP